MDKVSARMPDVGRIRQVTRNRPTPVWSTSGRAVVASLLAFSSLMLPTVLPAAEDQSALRPADTSSPRTTLKSFIDSCNELHQLIRTSKYFDRMSPGHRPLVHRILDCLDDRALPEYARESLAGEVAICLKEILDRVDIPPYEQIPAAESIEAAGGMEVVSQWRVPGTRLTIARIEEGHRRHEYLFTAGTVGRAVEYYQDVKCLPYRTTGPERSEGFHQWYFSAPGNPMIASLVDRVPDWARKQRLGITVWKWMGILISLLISILVMAAAYRLQAFFTSRWHGKSLFRYWLTILFPFVAMLVPCAFRHVVEYHLTLRGTPLYTISFAANLATFLAALVVVFGVNNRIAETVIAAPQIRSQGLDAQFIRIVSKLLSLVAAVVIFLEGGRYLGIPVTTLLAGAGVGGLALALAAQSTLKDLLGTMMVLLDKPYRVGERIILKHYDGFVDEIGLRSTKIRLLTGHVASIPNDVMAHSEIENVGRRQHIRRISDIHIPLDTPREKVEQAVGTIRTAFENHEGLDPDFPPRVYFNDFNSDSFNIRVIYWYKPPNYWDFLAFSEKVNVTIMRAFEQQEIHFSLPLRITYTATDSQPRPLELRMVHQHRTPALTTN